MCTPGTDLVEIMSHRFKAPAHPFFSIFFNVIYHVYSSAKSWSYSGVNQCAFITAAHNTEQGSLIFHSKHPYG